MIVEWVCGSRRYSSFTVGVVCINDKFKITKKKKQNVQQLIINGRIDLRVSCLPCVYVRKRRYLISQHTFISHTHTHTPWLKCEKIETIASINCVHLAFLRGDRLTQKIIYALDRDEMRDTMIGRMRFIDGTLNAEQQQQQKSRIGDNIDES